MFHLETKKGYETAAIRDSYGLFKSKNKLSNIFDAHCIDSWVLANSWVGGHAKPDNKNIMLITPLQFHRRQLFRLQIKKDGIKERYGGTRSLGLKRGSLVKHIKYGICYVGGYLGDRISLHSLENGYRLTQGAKVVDCKFLTYNDRRWTHS